MTDPFMVLAQPLAWRRRLRDRALLCLLLTQSGLIDAEPLPAGMPSASPIFSYEWLQNKAADLSRAPYQRPDNQLSEVAPALTPELWDRVHFRADALATAFPHSDSPIQLDYPAPFLPSRARVFQIQQGQIEEISFSPSLFDRPRDRRYEIPSSTVGFSGLHYLMAPSGPQPDLQSWLMFLGDGSIRAAPMAQAFGSFTGPLSVGQRSVDTGDALAGFREFYLGGKKQPGDAEVLYALLDTPEFCGAFRFTSRLGQEDITQEVDVALFSRASQNTLDLIPLISSFSHSESESERRADIHPEHHDADGLLIKADGDQWIWRPLKNSSATLDSTWNFQQMSGFGLLQRDRTPSHYLDDSEPERRPNVWVDQIQGLGPGTIRLTERSDTALASENIKVSFRPQMPLMTGAPLRYHYRIHWSEKEPSPDGLAHSIATRIGRLDPVDQKRPRGAYRFSVEYVTNQDLSEKLHEVSIDTRVSSGVILAKRLVPGSDPQHFFLELDYGVRGSEFAEIEAMLQLGGKPVAEHWRYAFRERP